MAIFNVEAKRSRVDLKNEKPFEEKINNILSWTLSLSGKQTIPYSSKKELESKSEGPFTCCEFSI